MPIQQKYRRYLKTDSLMINIVLLIGTYYSHGLLQSVHYLALGQFMIFKFEKKKLN